MSADLGVYAGLIKKYGVIIVILGYLLYWDNENKIRQIKVLEEIVQSVSKLQVNNALQDFKIERIESDIKVIKEGK